MYAYGFLKVAAASPVLKTGDVLFNVKEILKGLDEVNKNKADIVVFPEMCICGYSVCDLVFQEYLYQDTLKGIKYLLDHNTYEGVVIVGTFVKLKDAIYNCALVFQKNKILGIVPKKYLPHTNEFYETRWYVAGNLAKDKKIEINGLEVPFGNLIFTNADKQVQFGIEICEDLWAPMPPHEEMYANGAVLVFNASASPEVIGKADKRRMMVTSASYRCNGAYIYTSNNSSESSSEVLFSNHKMIVSNGEMLNESHDINLSAQIIYGDIDILSLHHIRRTNGWVKNILKNDSIMDREYIKVPFNLEEKEDFEFINSIEKFPFIPKEKYEYKQIIDVQATSVRKRLNYIGIDKTVLGVSGGLDSTLALLSLCHMCDMYKMSRNTILAYTLPSSNNSSTTYNNSLELMKKLHVNWKEINIKKHVTEELKTIGHNTVDKDVTYENTQARYRTFTLMNSANLVGGIVIGTSDMSEVALGWSTFNGDQMAMYAINSGLPKTVVKATVAYYKEVYPEVADILDSVIETPISPELSGSDQLTEDIIGKYDINDFILYHFLVNGDSNDRIVYLLGKAFLMEEDKAIDYVNNFYHRFYHQQYKRLTAPEGVKILDLSLSPRTQTRLSGDIYNIPIEKKIK